MRGGIRAAVQKSRPTPLQVQALPTLLSFLSENINLFIFRKPFKVKYKNLL